ncbi:Papilin [Aphelenchoides besseyi]|nr:Papilin [Aphelenchoides besseyi]
MRRRSALHWLLIALTIGVAISQEADPCKRQPFRGRCPATGSGQQQRSQFVLRYYLRNGECVSYPYGHCANDENEPKLFRYKEECEDTCIGHPSEEVETTVSQGGQTYATVSPGEESTSVASSTQTECQKQREQRGSSRIRGGFVPECTSDGKFRPLQCEPDGLSCFCVSNDGIEIPNSRATLPDQPKPNCDQLDKSRPATTNEPQSLSESETCLGGSAPLQASNGQPVDCSRNECPVGYKCSVGARRSVCCKDDQKGDKNAEALYSGQVPEFCLLPKERGPGDRYELRFYYNKERQSCHYFFYGGNSGNSNNFATIEQCMATCNAGPATKALSSTETTPTSKNEVPQTTSSVVETSRIETTAVWSTAGTTPPEAEDTEESEATSPVATSTVTETTTTEAMSRTSATEETTPESLVRFTDSTSGPSNAVDNDDMTESESTTKTTDAFSERQEQTEESTASVEVAQTSQPTESSSESVETRTEQPRPSIRTSQQTISPPAHTLIYLSKL